MIPRPSLLGWLRLRLQRIWLHWDRFPQDGTHLRPFCGIVEVRGWAVAADGIRSVSVYSDDTLVATAALGLRRRDLFRLFPHVRTSRRGGFQCLVDTRKIPNGWHTLTLVAQSSSGRHARITANVFVKNLSTSYDRYRQQTAPNAAAIAWMRRNAGHLPYRPLVSLGVTLRDHSDLEHAARSIESVQAQAYAEWELLVVSTPATCERLAPRLDAIVRMDQRVHLVADLNDDPQTTCRQAAHGEWFGILDAGDVLRADALFEMVYHLNRHSDIDLIYSDEETQGRPDAPAAPYFKADISASFSHDERQYGRLCLTRTGRELPPRRIEHVHKVLCSRRHSHGQQRSAVDEQPSVVSHAPCPLIDLEAIRSILVVKLDHLGDVLLTIPAMRRLRELFPEARITALVGSWARALLATEPCIDEVLTYDFFAASSSQGSRKLNEQDVRQTAAVFAGRRFDLAIDLRRESDTRQFLLYSCASVTVGYANRNDCDWLTLAIPWDDVVPVQPPRRHVSLDALRLVELVGQSSRSDVVADYRLAVPSDPHLNQLLDQLLPANPGLIVGLHAGAGRRIKCWPAVRFAQLADRLIEQLGATVVLFGTREDQAEVEGFLQHAKHREGIISLAYRLSLPQFLAALGRLDLFVGNDSGPTHMAAAAGLPTLGVYAATIDAPQWAPLGPQAAVIQRRMICSPCYLAKKQDCPYGVACLNELTVDQVWEAAVRVLLPKWYKVPLLIASASIIREEPAKRATLLG
jgi:ADP-heptose:LPS heptosyltransferase